MATITKESIAEAAKLSNMSVNDYIDKLPDNYLQEAAKLSNIDIATYKTKLKEVWGEGLKKKDDTRPILITHPQMHTMLRASLEGTTP